MKFADKPLYSYGPHHGGIKTLVSWLMPLIERSSGFRAQPVNKFPINAPAEKWRPSFRLPSYPACACLEPRYPLHAHGIKPTVLDERCWRGLVDALRALQSRRALAQKMWARKFADASYSGNQVDWI